MRDRGQLGFLWVSLFLAVLGQLLIAQKDLSWTLLPGLAFYLAAISLFVWNPPVSAPLGRLSPRAELGWILGIGCLALFFRLYHMTQIPPGMITEVTSGPWLGYAVPLSAWPPYFTGGLSLTHPDIPLWASLWFRLFEPSRLSCGFFYVFISSLAFPFGYLLFRDLAGPKTALWAIFFWGIMQWSVTSTRNGHPDITAPLYVLGALFFFRLAWRREKAAYWAWAGLFSGLGYYAYPLTRVCLPLLLVLFAYELCFHPSRRPFPSKGAWLFLAALLAAVSPCLGYMWQQQNWMTGSPHDHAFIGWQILEKKSLKPLWDNFSKVLFILNRESPPFTIAYFPGRRILDDATAVLFALGFFLGLAKWRESKYFYGVAGALSLSFPAVLSDQPLHTTRMFGMVPFIAYLAAMAVVEVGERINPSKAARTAALGWGIAAALVAVGENFKTYFWDRPGNEACWREAEVDDTQAGQAIAEGGKAYDYYLSPVFYGRFQTIFLGHAQRDHMFPLETPQGLGFLQSSPGRGLCFILQEGRTGVLAMLQKEYPGGATEKWLDPWGRPYLYLLRVPAEACSRDRFIPLDLNRAWKGTYWDSPARDSQPVLVQKDPVINFSYRDDFPVKNAPNLRVEWRGTLHPAKAGLYHFLLGATDHTRAEMEIDGKEAAALANQEAELSLAPKDYQVVIRYQREGGFESAFHLAWKPPGSDHYEIVPPEALR